MKPKALFNTLHNRLDQLSAREYKVVAYGSAVVAALITWFLLIEPAMLTIQQAPANQAALVDKAGQVMLAAQDLEALRGTRSRVVVAESDIQARLQQLLNEKGIAEQANLIRTEEGDTRVEFSNVSASGFLAWVAGAEAISNVTVNTAEIEKVEAGVLTGHVTLLQEMQGNPSIAR